MLVGDVIEFFQVITRWSPIRSCPEVDNMELFHLFIAPSCQIAALFAIQLFQQLQVRGTIPSIHFSLVSVRKIGVS